jgi:hypothetical protein
MQTPRHFRDQATLCLEIAQHISDPRAAENLRATAAQHFAQAVELEKQAGPSDTSRTLKRDSKRLDDFSDSFYNRAIRIRIGEALRTLLVPTEPAPERLLNALRALDR